MTIQQIKDEIRRRITKLRTGAATYPDLDHTADELQQLLEWIETHDHAND